MVDLTKDQIKDSPEYDKDKHRGNAAYRDQLSQYCGRGDVQANRWLRLLAIGSRSRAPRAGRPVAAQR
ncbi:hypothetical protein ACFYYM_40020 [Streptomyces erythrochromogenes]|uniref:hypothetical protein n=1 Tax=Streptomyces erythrochromogenes TaxID=285574 RepID=UPI0036C65FF8